jgi:tRNA pseudouridine38-40 synthase
MERALLLFLEFDGTDFCGWQRQARGRSVQQVVEAALSQLAGKPCAAVAAGRTDAGVHALAMPVSTTMPQRWTCRDAVRALNAVMPSDVAVREVRAVHSGVNARRAALGRQYRYDVGVTGLTRSPFCARTQWPLARELAVDSMQQAADALPGTHDFRAFAAVGEPKPHYDCSIGEARWERYDNVVRFTIAADRFLHHMVRMLVGTMVDVGLGRRPPADLKSLLTRTDNSATSPPAPAAGLTFVSATYPDSCFEGECATW